MPSNGPIAAVRPIPVTDAGCAMAADLAKIIDQLVARRIREQRIRRGMTQQKLAMLIGVAFQQAHKYERGLSRVSAGRLFHIATVLDMPINYFFTADAHSAAQRAVPIAMKVHHED